MRKTAVVVLSVGICICMGIALLSGCVVTAGTVSKELELKVTEGHMFFQGEDNSEKLSTSSYLVKKGDKLDLGGLSDLEIKITDVTENTVTFKPNMTMSTSGSTKDCADEFTVSAGTELKLNDLGICDAASWYIFEIADGTAETVGSADDKDVYSISVVKGKNMLVSCPESAAAGETVHIETFDVTDAILRISVNGEETGGFIRDCEYEFVMPAENVEISVEVDTSGFDV